MKINDAEKLLGVTKANIRFYEKEGLISPARSENGYREYSESDISRLKEIIILRKLGIPVQQVADILDGVLPLQDALDRNILDLQAEIEKLNGSLQLCRQLKTEDARTLDTERYWELINTQEQQGLLFQSIAEDYVSFVDKSIRNAWFIPESKKNSKIHVLLYILLHAAFWGLISALIGLGFWRDFGHWLYLDLVQPFILGIFLIPSFIIKRRDKEKGEIVDWVIRGILAVFILYIGMKCIFT